MDEPDTIPFAVDELQRALGLNQGYAPEEVAQALGVNVSTVYRWLQSGKLQGKQVGKQWRITADDVTRLVESQESERQRFIDAKLELRLAKKVKSDKEWSIQSCVICKGPIVTDGQQTPLGRDNLVYSPDGQELYACPWPYDCYDRLNVLLGYTSAEVPAVEPEDIPFE
jgi:DNA binding domain, excisionase family